ncbi:MAG: hypothetical protein ACPGTP_04760 [Bacteroidia bacterium]
MGNWDSVYYEIYEEVTQKGVKEKFDELLAKIATTEKFKHKPIRDRWSHAIQILRNNEK